MSDRMHVATRKGLFTVDRSSSGKWSIGQAAFVGDPVTMSLADQRNGTRWAALNLGHFGVKLHRSRDEGKSWEEVATPAFPEAAPGSDRADESKAPSVVQIWAMAAGGPGEPNVLWTGTIPGGLFHSSDGGSSWQLVESLWRRPERAKWFGGGYDHPGIHSICVDPRNARHVTVGVSCGGVWVTDDGGSTWSCRADGMVADYMPPESREDPDIQDPHRMVQCPAAPDVMWVQHHNGIFRTNDGARRWSRIESARPSAFGFAVAVHPDDPDTAWFVPGVKDECRVPVDGRLVVTRTRDGGRSFDVLSEGLPQQHAYDLVYRHAFDVDGTGKRLAMGSTTGNLWVSENGGDSWQSISTHLPPIYQLAFA